MDTGITGLQTDLSIGIDQRSLGKCFGALVTHKVEGSCSCSGAMKEIFRQKHPAKKSCPCSHVVEKPGTDFVCHE